MGIFVLSTNKPLNLYYLFLIENKEDFYKTSVALVMW